VSALAHERKDACAATYAHPAVRWLLGGELHPGGEATTRRALELIGVGPGDRLLDVACGTGVSALLAAREFGCVVAGVDYAADAVRDAQQAADAVGVCERVGFVAGDAEALPFAESEFDAVLCECSLCTFPDQVRAIAEIRRVLRPGGRLALSDVTAEPDRLPAALDGVLATLACVGEARSLAEYQEMLADAGLRVIAVESRAEDAAALADRVLDRLRGVRLLGLDWIADAPVTIGDAIELVRAARRAIDDGALGYATLTAAC
jgi:ubiquinone/menaquinone biosynthesis C-methylase UbiE